MILLDYVRGGAVEKKGSPFSQPYVSTCGGPAIQERGG